MKIKLESFVNGGILIVDIIDTRAINNSRTEALLFLGPWVPVSLANQSVAPDSPDARPVERWLLHDHLNPILVLR